MSDIVKARELLATAYMLAGKLTDDEIADMISALTRALNRLEGEGL